MTSDQTIDKAAPSFFGTRQGRHVFILAAVAVVLVLAAVVAITTTQTAMTSKFETFSFFPDLQEQAPDLAEVIITSKDEGTVRLAVSDKNQWVAPDKFDFPVKVDQLRGLLLNLLEAKAIETKTARADWHELLGLVSPEDGGQGVAVELRDSAGATLGSLIVGDNVGYGAVGSGGARYVRRFGEDQTYVAQGDLSINKEINDWVVRDVIDLFRERVKSVAVRPIEGTSYGLFRDSNSDENFKLRDIPEGREILSETTPNQLGSALANVTFDDVRPVADFDFSKAAQIKFETFDGLKASVAALKLGEDHWISVSVDLLPEDITPGSETPDGEEAAVAEGLKSRKDVEAEAALIGANTTGWAFQIPSWKGEAFQRDLESMLKPPASDTDGEVEETP